MGVEIKWMSLQLLDHLRQSVCIDPSCFHSKAIRCPLHNKAYMMVAMHELENHMRLSIASGFFYVV